MKKLMIAAAIVCATVAAQAAAINWNTGNIYVPTSVSPTFDGSIKNGSTWNGKMTSATDWTYQLFAIESTSAIDFEDGAFYKWYADGATGKFAGLTVNAGTVNQTTTAASASWTGASYDEKTPVYGAILLVATDGENTIYMENTALAEAAKGAVNKNALAMYEAGDTKGNLMVWQSVPEPTSGLLLLLGVAGLALRRRRA